MAIVTPEKVGKPHSQKGGTHWESVRRLNREIEPKYSGATHPRCDNPVNQFILLQDTINLDIVGVCVLLQSRQRNVAEIASTTSSNCITIRSLNMRSVAAGGCGRGSQCDSDSSSK